MLTYSDEFHHAVTDQYQRIVAYFKPEFMLGLTATPERMDGRSIYEICDYNVPYEISLKEAINKGMLVPFHYYGIYDDTDYSSLHVVRGRYDEKELNETYIGNVHRHEMIYKYYCKYGSKQALGFCCSREHAEEMAKDFSSRGIQSVAVYSGDQGEYAEERSTAIRKLSDGDIRVIFSVDMVNEGVDITSLDMVMFLRPTESPVVFLQQLGRGLRTYRGKRYLNVLDFIGNYEKAGRVRFYLTGQPFATGRTTYKPESEEYPDDCLVDFDLRLIDLFEQMEKKHRRLQDMVREEFYRVRDLLGHRPTRLELFTYMDADIYQMAVERANVNAGCGSGRDTLAFLSAGYQVDAFDASDEMCRIASQKTGIPVRKQRFEKLEGQELYDGIWACASLLHVAAADLPDVLVRLYRLLKKQGIMYVSFKLGDGERQKDGRYFNDMREEILCRLLCDAGFTVKETFITQDVRENRQDEAWVNVIAEA